MRVALCFDPHVIHQVRYRKALSSADVVVLPELIPGGYAAIRRGEQPHTEKGPLLSSLRSLSLRIPATVIAGSAFFVDRSLSETNTSFVFHRGKIVHRYDKIHLFKPGGDAEFFRPGQTAPTPFLINTKSQAARAGLIICYDLRFPELTRTLAAKGIDVLFVPARWPKVRDDAWQTLLKARAIENQIFVVGCNARGTEGGYSYIFSPMGERVFTNRKKQGSMLHMVDIDLDAIDRSHRLQNNLADAVFLRGLLAGRNKR